MKAFYITSLIFFAPYVYAQDDWVFVGTSVNNIDFYVKDLNKTYRPSVYTIWIKTFIPPQKIKNKKGNWTTIASKYTVSDWEIDCEIKEFDVGKSIEYNNKGIVVDSYEDYEGWSKIVPDSMAERVYKYSCYKND